jgi:uncharacterized protein with PIN domain
MPERIPISTEKKCPTCESPDVHGVPREALDATSVPHPDLHAAVEHLWACEKCRQVFRLVNG